MNDAGRLLKILGDILQTEDSGLVKQAEYLLMTVKNEKPSELICAYCDILKDSPEGMPSEVRRYAAFQLRLCLSGFDPLTSPSLWSKLMPSVQDALKTGLFELLLFENDQKIKSCLAITLGGIAACLI
jgi:hypothetical protein